MFVSSLQIVAEGNTSGPELLEVARCPISAHHTGRFVEPTAQETPTPNRLETASSDLARARPSLRYDAVPSSSILGDVAFGLTLEIASNATPSADAKSVKGEPTEVGSPIRPGLSITADQVE
ncbi:hypothetical protein GCM10009555_077150 [Acrocarpospora macrocephala]|uniref:Uncharacterized protein n=1 Tax=Acrocarpospora macrocephala TaxID=150177 RepID=A0A5M3X496_9ACTN|nr:hypothetical protein [Acrocarpospora macrocephala]GES15482.1 hypothetical protein Amac_090790 [Acrocarpospora macrocephala]